MGFWRIFGLEKAQWRRAILLFALLFLLTLAFEVGSDVIKALFLNRVGSKALPPAFVLEASLRLLATVLYFFLLRHRSYGRVMVVVTVAYGLTLGLMLSLLQSGADGQLTLFFALEQVGFKLIMLHWGVYIVDFFTVGESATAIPVVYSAQPLGAVVAGVLLAWEPFEDISWLLVVGVGAIAGALLVYPAVQRARRQSPRVLVGAPDPGEEGATGGWDYVFRAPIVRYMALATVALVLARAVLQVSAAYVLESQFKTARGIGAFLGYYKVYSNVFVFGLQATLAARLMRRFSAPRVNLSYAFLATAAFLGLFCFPGSATLVFAESVRKEWKSILKTPFSVMVYGTMADYARAPARIAIFGVIVPISGVLAGLGMMGVQRLGLGGQYLALAGACFGLVFIAVSLLQNRAYKVALVELLQDKLQRASTPTHTTSSLLKVPDGRILDIRHAREQLGYLAIRYRVAGRLFPELLAAFDPATISGPELLDRLEEMLLLVELYRPHGTPNLRSMMVAALTDGRVDLLDNATEVIRSVLPPHLARMAANLLDCGAARGVHWQEGRAQLSH
jgi:hypothetical protein